MPLKTNFEEQPGLDLTPMIDVVFLLIIFFMVGTKFAEWERTIALNVPELSDGGALTETPEARTVNVYSDGTITFHGEAVTLVQLTEKLAALKAENPRLQVQVRGDRASLLQHVAEVFQACKRAGVGELGLAVRLETVRR
jgi:biopolymer transport protein ExbD